MTNPQEKATERLSVINEEYSGGPFDIGVRHEGADEIWAENIISLDTAHILVDAVNNITELEEIAGELGEALADVVAELWGHMDVETPGAVKLMNALSDFHQNQVCD